MVTVAAVDLAVVMEAAALAAAKEVSAAARSAVDSAVDMAVAATDVESIYKMFNK